MFQSIGETINFSEKFKNIKSLSDLARVFQLKELEYRFCSVPKKLLKDTAINCETKIFWAIIHQLCGLGSVKYIQNDLANIFGVSVRTIQNYTKELRDKGWLETLRNEKDNRKIEYFTKSSKKFAAILNKNLFDFSVSLKAKALWLIYQEIGDPNGKSFYSTAKLGERIGMKDKETIKKYRNELEKAGWIRIEKGKGHRSKDIYVIWPDDRPNPKLISAMRKSKASEKRQK
jgi:DNA-binding MarR family transcriptional regulator